MDKTTHFVPYVYTFESHVKVAQLEGRIKVKIGDTHRGLDVGLDSDTSGLIRIGEQIGTSNAEQPIIIKTWHQEKTRGFHRDYDLHLPLKRAGRHITDAGGKEWFYLDYPVGASRTVGLKAALADLDRFVTRLTGSHIRRIARFRKRQESLLTKALEAVEKRLDNRISQTQVCSIIAYLCPRFGKTIWALELFRRINERFGNDILILPAYVLSAHTSFANEILEYVEFKNMVYIEARDGDDWHQDLDAALSDGKLVVISVSMHASNKFQFDPLRLIDDGRKVEFVDEADLGAWTSKSREISSYLSNGEPTTGIQVKIDASGTNITKIALGLRGAEPDAILQVAYCELEKSEPGTIRRSLYQMELTDKALAGWIEAEGNFTWARAWANVDISAPVLRRLMIGLFDDPEKDTKFLSLNPVLGKDCEVAMCFTTADNAELMRFGGYTVKWLPDYEVVILCGSADNMIPTTNAGAEAIVKDAIANAKRLKKRGVIILTNTMGTRSFSVTEVEASIIMRDRGSVAMFTQAGLRTCTPGVLFDGVTQKSRGIIVSLSIDPNRDNVTEMLLDEARVVITNNPGMTLPEALRDYVLDTVSIFRKNPKAGVSSYVQLKKQDLLEELQTSRCVLDVANALTDINAVLDAPDILDILRLVKIADDKGGDKENPLLTKGKTYAVKLPRNPRTKEEKKELEDFTRAAKDALRTLNETATSVLFLSEIEKGSYGQALACISQTPELNYEFQNLFGIGAGDAITLLERGFLRSSLLDIVVHNSAVDVEDRKSFWN